MKTIQYGQSRHQVEKNYEVLVGSTRPEIWRRSSALDDRSAQRKNRSTAPETLVTSVVKKGGYRTLCVRMCDGYYFAISFSAQPRNFARDQNACSAMRPAGNAKLYYHPVPEQESDAMIAVADKKPYSELPNAFNYRTAGVKAVPGCACHAAQNNQMNVVSEKSIPSLEVDSTAVAAEANGVGPLNVAVESEEPAQGDVDESEATQRNVRMVGTAFLPVETGAIDFRSPACEKKVEQSRAGILTPGNIVRTITSDILRRIQ
jgi:hypothetical protein